MPVVSLTFLLFGAMLACLEIGRRLGCCAVARDQAAHDGVGALETAIFGLLGLLLGFAFAGAVTRLDVRKELAVTEANAIRTAYLRIDLLTANQQTMRSLFRDYLDARIQVYDAASLDQREVHILEATNLQKQIWEQAVDASRSDPTDQTVHVVLPAINAMIDVTTARTLALQTRTAPLILALLCGVALVSALMAGYAMSVRSNPSLVHMVSYAACVALTVFAVLDLDDPRVGITRLAAAEALLHDLRDSIVTP